MSGYLRMDSRITEADPMVMFPPETPFQSFEVVCADPYDIRTELNGRRAVVLRRTRSGPISVTFRGTMRSYGAAEEKDAGARAVGAAGRTVPDPRRSNRISDWTSPRFEELLDRPPGARRVPRNAYDRLTASAGLRIQPGESEEEFLERIRWYLSGPDPRDAVYQYYWNPLDAKIVDTSASEFLGSVPIRGDCGNVSNLTACVLLANGIDASAEIGRWLKDGGPGQKSYLDTFHAVVAARLRSGPVIVDMTQGWGAQLSGTQPIIALHEGFLLSFAEDRGKGFYGSKETVCAQEFFTTSGVAFKRFVRGGPLQRVGGPAGWSIESPQIRVRLGEPRPASGSRRAGR